MEYSGIEFAFFLVFIGAALLATLALYARQALIVAYIAVGVVLGPWGLALLDDPEVIAGISDIGVIFLLYLLGLDLLPQQLGKMLGGALWTTLLSSLLFFLAGFGIAAAFGYALPDALVIGAAMMFSSTIIGVKLLSTTVLHHRHIGQLIISVLLLQDVIAIIVLSLLQGYGSGDNLAMDIGMQLLALPALIGACWLFERQVLIRLITRFDQIHEYIFLLAIAWCMAVAEAAVLLGLSHEIGAFIAGVTLASSPIAFFITEKLKPLRDFFLILFFFSMGASFNLGAAPAILAPALALAAAALVMKPLVFVKLLKRAGEKRVIAREVGFRLGQVSEFSLLIAVLAAEARFIQQQTSYLIQLATLLTFLVSSYLVVRYFRTPISPLERLRQD